VILHENLTVVQRCREIISEWLKGIGLELKPSKTRLVHTLNQHEECKPGFNFLGFHIRQFPTGKYTTGKNGHGKPLGFKTIITPTKEKCQAHHKQIAEVILAHRGASQKKLIGKLNPIVKGWANYYSTVSSKKAFSKLDDQLFDTLQNWAKRRHRNKGKKWIASKYWKTKGGDNWVFATKVGNIDLRLHKHSSTPIKNYVKVKGESSPYDGNLIYWSSRMGKHPEMPQRTALMLKQ
jgi:RNA-directed DNA polymerase